MKEGDVEAKTNLRSGWIQEVGRRDYLPRALDPQRMKVDLKLYIQIEQAMHVESV